MTYECNGTCQGEICGECQEHVHPWDGSHWNYCWPGQRREIAEKLTAFLAEMEHARAVTAGRNGIWHAADCGIVKAHITFGHKAIASTEVGACWDPWIVTTKDREIGYTGRCCSPPIVVQPYVPPRRLVRRLTGIGWPGDNGRCPKGRLPLWTREPA